MRNNGIIVELTLYDSSQGGFLADVNKELNKKRDDLDALLMAIGEMLIVVDPHFNIIHANKPDHESNHIKSSMTI